MYPKLPGQPLITRVRIEEMLTWKPRRFRLAELGPVLKEPRENQKDWNLYFPFYESFVPAFEAACEVNHREFESKEGQTFCYTFLWNVDEEQIRSVKTWLSAIEEAVGIRDCLAMSFALDYDRERGDPHQPPTRIGTLRRRAKPYDRIATPVNRSSASELGKLCVEFLNSVTSFNEADAVVAVPSSDPDRDFSLPDAVAKRIAEDWELEELCDQAITTHKRPQLKNLPVSEKLDAIESTLRIGSGVRGKNILLVDDLYQSGVTMNCVAMKLLEAGALAVYGLACEKTCSNFANVTGEE